MTWTRQPRASGGWSRQARPDHRLRASALASEAVSLGAPALGQAHIIVPASLTGSALALGAPLAGCIVGLTASGLATGQPVLGAPVADEVYNVPAAVTLAAGTPAAGAPAMGQKHALRTDADWAERNPFTTGAVVLGTPAFRQNLDTLAPALGLSTGVPALGTPAFQTFPPVNIPAAVGLATGAPVLGSPAATEFTAGVRYRSTGAANGTFGAASCTVALPTGWQTDDILLLFVGTANETVATPSGWTAVTPQQGTGTAGAASNSDGLAVFWKRAVPGETAPAVTDPGRDAIAFIVAVAGAVTSGNPIEASAGDVAAAATTSISWPGVTTLGADRLILHVFAAEADVNSSTIANASLSGLALTGSGFFMGGRSYSLSFVRGMKASAGATGTTTATTSGGASVQARITLAVTPA